MASVIFALELADLSQLWGKIQDIALDPVKNTLYYFVPFLGAMSSKYTPLSSKDPARHLMTDAAKTRILSEISRLGQSAELTRQFNVYTTLNQPPMSYGGSLSLTRPILVLPYELLIRPNASSFGAEKSEEKLKDSIHLFSDDETRFIIAEELSHLKFNDALIKTAAKILLIGAALFLYASPLGWAGTAAVVGAAFLIYLIADRYYESKIDLVAVKITGRAIEDDRRAAAAALNVLKKIRAQNLEKRESGFFNRLFITKAGNHLLDFKHPFITSRIRNMQNHLDQLAAHQEASLPSLMRKAAPIALKATKQTA
jgi:hypothetical protein